MRAAAMLEDISAMVLSRAALTRAEHALDRRVLHYKPMLGLVEILWSGTSLDLEEDGERIEVPGFLFDMNRFWQALLGRLLRENIADADVIEDRRLRGALRYADGFPHPKFRTPTARPDFVVKRAKRPIAVLDAKYRDLWAKDLPSSMLYQLAVYAATQGHGGVAAILYPTESAEAREVRVEVCSPGSEAVALAMVALRPVHLDRLAAALAGTATARQVWVRALAGLAAPVP
jgi:5-methylcytosine-specific restriction enzyme subunit McrC